MVSLSKGYAAQYQIQALEDRFSKVQALFDSGQIEKSKESKAALRLLKNKLKLKTYQSLQNRKPLQLCSIGDHFGEGQHNYTGYQKLIILFSETMGFRVKVLETSTCLKQKWSLYLTGIQS